MVKCHLLLSIINETNLKLDFNNSKCHSKDGVDNNQLLLPCIHKLRSSDTAFRSMVRPFNSRWEKVLDQDNILNIT